MFSFHLPCTGVSKGQADRSHPVRELGHRPTEPHDGDVGGEVILGEVGVQERRFDAIVKAQNRVSVWKKTLSTDAQKLDECHILLGLPHTA